MALKYPELFKPFKIGKVTVKNRVVMSAMHNIGWTDSYDLMTDRVIDYFEERAKGGVGLIFTGSNQPNYQLHNNGHMVSPFANPGACMTQFKKLADRVHAYGCKVFVQCGYGDGGHNSYESWLNGDPVAVSDLENRWNPSIRHRALSKEEIQGMIDATVEAAVIAKMSGVDGLDINSYGGYVSDEFLIDCFNHRTDEYGGSMSGKTRFLTEIRRRIKEACGPDFPVTCRIGTKTYLKGLRQGVIEGEQYTEYGRDVAESIEMAKYLEEAGYDAFYIGNGTYDSMHWLYPPMYQKEGLWLDDVAPFKEAVGIPVLCGGKILQPKTANAALEAGKVDAIVLGRALLADPYWVNKAKLGQDEDIRPCIGCNNGCVGHIFAGMPQECAVNSSLFREREDVLQKADNVKKVAVIGGGIAGMECARVAALRGHDVTLYEKSGQLGGTFRAASVPACKSADRRLLSWYEHELEKAGVKVAMNKKLSLDDVKALDADALVVATGNTPKKLPVPGLEQENVITVVDAFMGRKPVLGNKVLIIGGGVAGCEAAVWAAEELGKAVSLIEAMPELLMGGYEPVPDANKQMLEELLAFHKVNVMRSTFIKSVSGNVATVSGSDGEVALEADTIILAAGFNANDKLFREISESIDKPVWCLGDAQSPSNIMFGIRDANAVARII